MSVYKQQIYSKFGVLNSHSFGEALYEHERRTDMVSARVDQEYKYSLWGLKCHYKFLSPISLKKSIKVALALAECM